MSTLLADAPATGSAEQPGGEAAAPLPEPNQGAEHHPSRACAKCGAPLADGQDWCLNCGTGAPDSLGSRTPTWRSAALLAAALAVLVAGAATAAYAALNKGAGKPRAPVTVAKVTPPASSTPLPATPGVATTPNAGTPSTIKPLAPSTTTKLPKIPITPSVTPKTTPAVTTPAVTTPATTTTPKTSGEGGTPAGEAPQAEAIMLDTNAASTYNPYNYPANNFGDPSLAIDGDSTTGWTSLVEPSVAPKMADGLLVDFNTPRRVSAVAITTSTPGVVVQVYGASGSAPPTSITDPAWNALSASVVLTKGHMRIKLGGDTAASKGPHRFVVLWLSKAPQSAVGTPQKPGHVSINELEYFPPKGK